MWQVQLIMVDQQCFTKHGRAEKDTGEKSTKVVNDMEKKESKVKKAIKKVLGKKKK